MSNFFKNKFVLLIFIILTIGLAWRTEKSIVYENVEFDIDKALKEKVSEKGYFDRKILLSIEKENFDDVEMYQKLAEMLNIELEQSTKDKIAEKNTFYEKSIRNTKSFTSGFIEGKGDNAVSMAGSIASDMTVIGDLRDLSREGMKLSNNEKYDKVVLGVAVIGVGLSVSQLLTIGSSTPLKIGASIIKIAKKSKKLSKGFLSVISSKLSKAVDMKKLKSIDFSTISGLKKAQPKLAESIKVEKVSKLFGKINKVKKNTSTSDAISLLKYVNSEKDLKKLVKVSDKYKKNTRGVFKVLGKSIFRGATKIAKYTAIFFTQLILAIISAIGTLIGAFINLKMLISWIRRVRG